MNDIAALYDQVLTSSYGLILSGCGGQSTSANNSDEKASLSTECQPDVKPKSVAVAGGECPHQRQGALSHLRRQAVFWGAI
jgi:hypothetical protein